MISESIFSGKNVIVPMKDVQHIEKQYEEIYDASGFVTKYIGTNYNKITGIMVITNHTLWNFEYDCWENAIWIGNADNQAQEFISTWCYYRHELEQEARDG